ncbi:hypothetical protein QBC43DRAFT_362946 [Cladorrhinum sp. PSN259]|nr:hypothetical protein QBC43DRAFT_362946 [Cladorrhinum sp. PSN259]
MGHINVPRNAAPKEQESRVEIIVASSLACLIVSTRLGLGTHFDTNSVETRRAFLLLMFFASLGYHVYLMLLKATFLLQYRRVFPLPTFQRICDIFMFFLAVWALAGLVGGTTICLPLSKSWDPFAHVWTCEKRVRFWIAHGIIHVVTDILILIMPLPLLQTLPLPPVQKMALIGVFCLGFLTCLVSVMRINTIRQSLHGTDLSWASSTTVLWSFAEVTCSIVCLCIPTLRPLLGGCLCRCMGTDNIRDQEPGDFRLEIPNTIGTGRPSSSIAPLTEHDTSNSNETV